MTCKTGEIVLVSYPFTDLSQMKLRPALVISPDTYGAAHRDVVLVALTTQPQADAGLGLAHWRDAGLPKPTWVKPIILTLATSRVIRQVGLLRREDWSSVKIALDQMIASAFR